MQPNDRVGLVIDDHGDVFMPLFVARLIDPDLPKTVEPHLQVRLNVCPRPTHAAPYRRPVDSHKVTGCLLVDLAAKPGHRLVKIFGEF